MIISPESLAANGSEDSHCKALMQWCNLNIKEYPQLKWFAHIPNGGERDLREGSKFKVMGVKPGFPDYVLPYPKWGEDRYAGLYLEMKREIYRNRKDGGCSADQIKWLAYLNEVGYKAIVCYSWEEARDQIIGYLNG